MVSEEACTLLILLLWSQLSLHSDGLWNCFYNLRQSHISLMIATFQLASGHRKAPLNIFICVCCYVYLEYFETRSSQPGSVLNILYSQCVYSPWSCEAVCLGCSGRAQPVWILAPAANTHRGLTHWEIAGISPVTRAGRVQRGCKCRGSTIWSFLNPKYVSSILLSLHDTEHSVT